MNILKSVIVSTFIFSSALQAMELPSDHKRVKLQALLDNNEDLNKAYKMLPYEDEEYPLHIAASNDYYNDLLQELIKRGACLTPKDEYKNNIFHKCRNAPRNLTTILTTLEKDNIKKMIKEKNKWGASPLHEAATSFNKPVIELLLNNGADVNTLDTHNKTPFTHAFEVQTASIAIGYLDPIKQAEAKKRDEEAAQQFRRNKKECLLFLLANGANINKGTFSEYSRTTQDLLMQSILREHEKKNPSSAARGSSRKRTKLV